MNFDEVKWVDFQDVKDERGRLTAIEGNSHIPFEIKRIFYVHQVVPGIDRGGHAHIDTDQVITAVHGGLQVDISDGKSVRTYQMDDPGKGLYVPRMFWIRLYDFSPGGVCLVFANTLYNMKQSHRTWASYLDARELPFIPAPGTVS